MGRNHPPNSDVFNIVKHALVVGWYSHGNLGDEAFRPAFRSLWGDRVNFTFADQVPRDINDYDALIFGGGSFLDRPIPSLVDPSHVSIPVGFVGVGIHGVIHPQVQSWLDVARVVVIRNEDHHHLIPDALVGPDLFLARSWDGQRFSAQPRRLLILGNDFITPRHHAEDWQRESWLTFSTTLPRILEERYADWQVVFYPMCTSDSATSVAEYDDRVFAGALISQLTERSNIVVYNGAAYWHDFVEQVEDASMVFSLRLHGCITAALLGCSFVGISMHDKMRSFFADARFDNWVDYYHFNRDTLDAALARQPTNLHSFKTEGYDAWGVLSRTITAKLGL